MSMVDFDGKANLIQCWAIYYLKLECLDGKAWGQLETLQTNCEKIWEGGKKDWKEIQIQSHGFS